MHTLSPNLRVGQVWEGSGSKVVKVLEIGRQPRRRKVTLLDLSPDAGGRQFSIYESELRREYKTWVRKPERAEYKPESEASI